MLRPLAKGKPTTTAVIIAVVILPIYLLTATYSTLQSNDPRSAALAGWSLVSSGSLAFDDRWPSDAASWGVQGEDGRTYSNRFPGIVTAAVVAYGLADFSGALDTSPVAHPYDVPLWPATVLATLIAAAAVAVTYLVLRRLELGERTALVATGVTALASPVWSLSADTLWTHGLTHLLLLLALLAMLNRRLMIASITVGLAVTVRPHLAPAIVVLALITVTRRERVAIWMGVAAGVALVAAYSQAVFGQPLPAAGYDVEGLAEALPIASLPGLLRNLLNWLVDPLRGLAIYAPLAVAGLAVVPTARAQAPRWAKVSALAGLTYAATQLSLIRASGGWLFFGHRTTIEMLVLTLPFLVVGFHYASTESLLVRRVLTALIILSFAIHALGAVIGMPRPIAQSLLEYQMETGPGHS